MLPQVPQYGWQGCGCSRKFPSVAGKVADVPASLTAVQAGSAAWLGGLREEMWVLNHKNLLKFIKGLVGILIFFKFMP
jgi:hypothetical protein